MLTPPALSQPGKDAGVCYSSLRKDEGKDIAQQV